MTLENVAYGVRAGHHYCAFGLRIASELPLPELASFGSPPQTADLTIRFEPLPISQEAAHPPFQVNGDEVLLRVDKVARYRIARGCEISIDPYPGVSEQAIRLFLLGSALGALCHQRGLLPLHANAIVVNQSAIAIAGNSGVGKSTLAAYFQTRGYQVLCDDVCVVSFGEDGRPLAWPGLPRLRLLRDAAEIFGHDSQKLERAIDGSDKYHLPMATVAAKSPFPLARVYVLSDLAIGAEAKIVPLTGLRAVQAIIANTYRMKYLRLMGLTKVNFMQAASLARHAQIFEVPRRRGYDVFDEEAARLESHFSQRNPEDIRDDCAVTALPLSEHNRS